MVKNKVSMVVFVFAALLLMPTAAEAKGAKIVGDWNLTSVIADGKALPMPAGMKVTMSFTKDGKFTSKATMGDKVETENGTYKINGRKLTTTTKKKTETITVIVTRTSLTATSGGTTMKFKRAK